MRALSEAAFDQLKSSLSPGSRSISSTLFGNEKFRRWVSAYPQVRLQADRLKNGYGWNVKPQAIMRLLDAGFDEIIWIDSDVLVTRDMRLLFQSLDDAVFVATEHTLAPERDDGMGLRAQLWHLSIGPSSPGST